MDATTLRTSHLLLKLQNNYPKIAFAPSDLFRWSPHESTVYFAQATLDTPEGAQDLFHELAHALLDHQEYSYDITLVRMEAEAWNYAKELSAQYGIPQDEAYANESIDSYRDWLAKRSCCPECGSAGMQKNKRTYQCINCRCAWHVNDAKFCGLKRYKTN